MAQRQRKTKVAYIGQTISGLKARVGLVGDEGLMEARRYLSSLRSRNERVWLDEVGITTDAKERQKAQELARR